MAGKTVDIDSLQHASIALQKYIGRIQYCINRLNSAAQDCSDNMGSDVYSSKAISYLGGCTKEISLAIKEAEDIQKRIQKKIREIEESGRSF